MSAAARHATSGAGHTSIARAYALGWSRLQSSQRSARSAGAGAATGAARRRITCTSPRPGTDLESRRSAGANPRSVVAAAGSSSDDAIDLEHLRVLAIHVDPVRSRHVSDVLGIAVA